MAVSETGYGHCPRAHGKSFDPHWYARSLVTTSM